MPPEIVTVFRSRLHVGVEEEYGPLAARTLELARAMPGFVDAKTFEAADGERVTVVTFADQASHDAWRQHPDHREAQRAGRDHLYSWYRIQVAEVQATREFGTPR